MEVAGIRKDVAFTCEFPVSERWACKLMGMDRGSDRYEPGPDWNGPLHEALVSPARQKPLYGYRRPHAPLERREHPASVMRYTGCIEQKHWRCGGSKRKRLSPDAIASHLVRSNQEWALDFACDTEATSRGIRVLALVEAFRRENLSSEGDTSLSSRRATRPLE